MNIKYESGMGLYFLREDGKDYANFTLAEMRKAAEAMNKFLAQKDEEERIRKERIHKLADPHNSRVHKIKIITEMTGCSISTACDIHDGLTRFGVS